METEWTSENGDVRLICGDCLEWLPKLETGSVDAVVTDPPYGIGFTYSQHDDNSADYERMMKQAVLEVSRVCSGMSFFWQAMLNADSWHRWFPARFRLFAACKGMVQFRPTPIQFSWDPIVFWGDSKATASVYRKDYHLQSLAPFGVGRERIDHPCPRPLEQTKYVVSIASEPSMTVLDPFMGSGTTGVACVQTGRRFVGIEISRDYYEIAKKRIQTALMQMRMPGM